MSGNLCLYLHPLSLCVCLFSWVRPYLQFQFFWLLAQRALQCRIRLGTGWCSHCCSSLPDDRSSCTAMRRWLLSLSFDGMHCGAGCSFGCLHVVMFLCTSAVITAAVLLFLFCCCAPSCSCSCVFVDVFVLFLC